MSSGEIAAYRFGLLAVLAFGAMLRFSALDFGGSVWAVHPDEQNVLSVLRAMDRGDLDYFEVAYGGGYYYPLHAFFAAYRRWVSPPAMDSQPRDIFGNSLEAYVAARVWSALLSTLGVWLTFVVGTRVSGRLAGLLAAGMVASSPLAVRDAHLAKADSACAFAVTVLLLALVRTGAGPRRWLPIGAAAGLAASIKYMVGPIPAVVAAFAQPSTSAGPRRRAWRVAGGITLGTAVFLTLNPFWASSPGRTWWFFQRLVRSQREYVAHPWFADVGIHPIPYHAAVSLRYGCGLLMALLALPSVWLGWRQHGSRRLLGLTVVGQWIILATNPLALARNFLPCIPALAVLVADLVAVCLGRLRIRPRPRVAIALLALVALEPAARATTLVRIMSRPDTRTLADRWMATNVPRQATVVVAGAPPGAPSYGAPGLGLPLMERKVSPSIAPAEVPTFVVWHHYPIPYSSAPAPEGVRAGTPTALFDPFSGPLRHPVFEPFDAFYLPLAGFSGVRSPGPRIEIFAVNAR